MITDTLFIFGPGGTGKHSLDHLLKDDVVRIYPHVLRKSGPRGTHDIRYAHPGLYDNIIELFRVFGTMGRHLPADETVWRYTKPGTLCYKVRGEYHILFLHRPYWNKVKVEIYPPVLPVILKNQPSKNYFGGIVYNNWKFYEYLYTAANRTELLIGARNCLLDRNPQLEIF